LGGKGTNLVEHGDLLLDGLLDDVLVLGDAVTGGHDEADARLDYKTTLHVSLTTRIHTTHTAHAAHAAHDTHITHNGARTLIEDRAAVLHDDLGPVVVGLGQLAEQHELDALEHGTRGLLLLLGLDLPPLGRRLALGLGRSATLGALPPPN
jgi:hypothetical protein